MRRRIGWRYRRRHGRRLVAGCCSSISCPSQPSNLRVSTWRRLQQIGAIALKQAVYVLPDSPEAREDFEWLKTEMKGAGGEASVFAADNLDAWSDDALIEEFRRTRQDGLRRAGARRRAGVAARQRRPAPRGTRAPARRRGCSDVFRERLVAIERIDFFGSAGRDRVLALLAQLEDARQRDGRFGSPASRLSGRRPAIRRGSGSRGRGRASIAWRRRG